jgi:hypothetical protein
MRRLHRPAKIGENFLRGAKPSPVTFEGQETVNTTPASAAHTRRPRTFKQHDLTRAIKALRNAGGGHLSIAKDGTINISVLTDADASANGSEDIVL